MEMAESPWPSYCSCSIPARLPLETGFQLQEGMWDSVKAQNGDRNTARTPKDATELRRVRNVPPADLLMRTDQTDSLSHRKL
ncbi:hypothetical protein chiPu_0004098 [Chiloscyllium punctatum]|uniref:Uncharacterized protein n=1 Tax=Chiloscyllium punctatum TaxID=137246 RepID=A0A401S5M7_CHIPU|nr:hypothetical protein [Chiloscyllium punctatum]